MTTLHERTRTILQTRDFLHDLLRGEYAPSVPDVVRNEAFRLLRHYPDAGTMIGVACMAPFYFSPPKEPD